jgi:hypothetical protein
MVPRGVESVYARVAFVDDPDTELDTFALSIAVTGVWVCNVRSKPGLIRDLAS